MGFIVKADLETTQGSTFELYARIESIVLNRVSGKIKYQITYWVTQDHAIKSTKVFTDSDQQKYQGLVSERILVYTKDLPEGSEIVLPHMIEEDLAEDKEVEVPIFETVETSEEVPYVSFDNEGNEITLYRTVTSVKEVKVGSTYEIRRVINPALACDIYKLGYGSLKRVLEKFFSADSIVVG